jgi:DNA-binding NtrC family response regulator
MTRIAVADDELQIRRILSVLLSERGYEVATAESGEQLLDMQPSFKPDIVLLDLSMPGIDRLETLEKLVAQNPRIDCIMMTAYGSIRSAVQAMRLGAFDYLSKPFDNDELLLIVERAARIRRLDNEVDALRTELESRYGFNEIIGISPQITEVFRIMAKVAAVNATVLICGESGTGKELVARAIHRRGPRAGGAFVPVNCSAIPRDLVETEFFGHEKGAFTDARESHPGKFEAATGGTLFLDEVGDLALDAQSKLLRCLQEREIFRVGGIRSIPVDVRVIAATNRNLERAVENNEFREDLYWRLNVVTINLPPLRERRQDLPLLIDHFLDRFQNEMRLGVKSISPEARDLLLSYGWPGNVRELENTLCRAVILCESEVLRNSDLPPRIRGELPATAGASVDDRLKLADAVKTATERVEKTLIAARLAQHGNSRTATAESLGISRKTLFNKMREYNLGAEDEDSFS